MERCAYKSVSIECRKLCEIVSALDDSVDGRASGEDGYPFVWIALVILTGLLAFLFGLVASRVRFVDRAINKIQQSITGGDNDDIHTIPRR
uniref:Uncharacterized protein n=1 Tax=Plectus sambesii TaxID=2011161 RepID=A0A914WTU4_9BILA